MQKKNKSKMLYMIVCIAFVVAAGCFAAGAVNHILNTGEGVLSSIFLALGCLCMACVWYRLSKTK